jgi:hypothetical protein
VAAHVQANRPPLDNAPSLQSSRLGHILPANEQSSKQPPSASASTALRAARQENAQLHPHEATPHHAITSPVHMVRFYIFYVETDLHYTAGQPAVFICSA